MKKILVSLFCLLLFPVIMPAVSAQEEVSQPGGSAQIMVNANREAVFHYPRKGEFPYLSAAVKVGEISLSDLFLQEDESLLMTAETVPLALQNGEAPQSSIPFDVTAESLESSGTVLGM